MTAPGIRPVIRDAGPSDVPDVFRLLRGLAAYERELDTFRVTEAGLAAMLFGEKRRAEAILAETEGGHAAGLALFYFTLSTFTGRPGLFLEDLFVEPEHRGTGIGYALLRRVAARAAADDCNMIEWRVLNWNQPAIDFYERIGATPVTKWHVRQLGGKALTALAQGDTDG